MDSDDIALILGAEQKFGQLNQDGVKMLLGEKNRREEVQRAQKQREENLRLAAEAAVENKMRFELGRTDAIADREDKQAAASALVSQREMLLRNRPTKAATPAEKAEYELRMKKLDLGIKQAEKELAAFSEPKPLTLAEEIDDKRMQVEQERKNLVTAFNADKQVQEDLALVASSYVDKDGNVIEVPFEEQEANAKRLNFKSTSPIYYKTIQPEVVPGMFNDKPGYVEPLELPRHPKTGRQYIMGDVKKLAQANNMTVEEVLQRWKVLP